MAWQMSRREGLTSADFDEWVKTVDDWFLGDKPTEEGSDDDDAPDPSSTSAPEAPTG